MEKKLFTPSLLWGWFSQRCLLKFEENLTFLVHFFFKLFYFCLFYLRSFFFKEISERNIGTISTPSLKKKKKTKTKATLICVRSFYCLNNYTWSFIPFDTGYPIWRSGIIGRCFVRIYLGILRSERSFEDAKSFTRNY